MAERRRYTRGMQTSMLQGTPEQPKENLQQEVKEYKDEVAESPAASKEAPTPDLKDDPMKCGKCKRRINLNWKFCPHCGNRL